MDIKTLNQIVAKARMRQDVLLQKKGDDYTASNGERLFNFNFVSIVLGLPRRTVWAVYFLKHVLAVMNFCRGGQESEPIRGRLDDVANYAYLLEAIIEEEEAPLKEPVQTDSGD